MEILLPQTSVCTCSVAGEGEQDEFLKLRTTPGMENKIKKQQAGFPFVCFVCLRSTSRSTGRLQRRRHMMGTHGAALRRMQRD